MNESTKAVLFSVFYISTVILVIRSVRLAFKHWGPGAVFWNDPKSISLVLYLAIPRALIILSMPLNGNEAGGEVILYHKLMMAIRPASLFLPAGYPFLSGSLGTILQNLVVFFPYLLLIIQHLLGLLTALMLYETLKPRYPRVAWGLSLFWGISSFPLMFEHTTRPEFFATFLIFLCFYLILKYWENSRSLLLWYLGIAAGWAELTRPNFVVLLPIIAGSVYWGSKSPPLERLKHLGRLCAGFVFIYFGFIVLVHHPNTGLWSYNWSIPANLRVKMIDSSALTEENDAYMELVKDNYQIGQFLKQPVIAKYDFNQFLDYVPLYNRLPVSIKLRDKFSEFNHQYPVHEPIPLVKPDQFARLYPPEYASFGSVETGLSLGEAFYGIVPYTRLELSVYKKAILLNPMEYMKTVIRDLPHFLGFGSGNDKDNFLPPHCETIFSSPKFLGFYWDTRPGLDTTALGLYWSVGTNVLRGWAVINRFVFPYIYSVSFIYAMVLFLRIPPPARLAFLFFGVYLFGMIWVAPGSFRLMVPLQPIGMFLFALPCSKWAL